MCSHQQTKQIFGLLCFSLCFFTAIVNAMPVQEMPSQEDLLAKKCLYRMMDRETRSNYPINLAALRELKRNLRLGMSHVKRGLELPSRPNRGSGLCLWKVCPTAPWREST